MSVRILTMWVILGVSLALGIYDVYAYMKGSGTSTISVVITDWSIYSPWIPFLFGFVAGHWFAPAKRSDVEKLNGSK